MRTPPADLDSADVAAVLAVEWGLRDVGLTHAPVGFGGHHWVADVGGRPVWFVTAQPAHGGLRPAFHTAVALAEVGLPFVVAPVATELGEVAVPYRGYLLSITPWHPDAREHPADGPEVVDVLVALHAATDAVRTVCRPDDLAVEGRPALAAALTHLDRPWGDRPYAADLRALVTAAGDRLRAALVAHDRRTAGVDPATFVVTHGEPKPGNLLTTPAGVVLVDWDTVLLAPPERDLWRLTDADRETYATATGRRVDPAVLELYRRRWDLTDVALHVEQLRRASDRTEDTETAWTELQRLLAA